jgi:hypothetical protein
LQWFFTRNVLVPVAMQDGSSGADNLIARCRELAARNAVLETRINELENRQSRDAIGVAACAQHMAHANCFVRDVANRDNAYACIDDATMVMDDLIRATSVTKNKSAV